MSQLGIRTADELLGWYSPGARAELVRGRLIVSEPAGGKHGAVANRLAFLVTAYVERHTLGRVYAAETGFKIAAAPDTVRAPDVAFVARNRVPEQEPEGYPELAPDLVIEVLSPNDRPGEVLSKVGDWLVAGSRIVWVVDPSALRAQVYRADGSVATIDAAGVLEGEDVLPGFQCRLDELP